MMRPWVTKTIVSRGVGFVTRMVGFSQCRLGIKAMSTTTRSTPPTTYKYPHFEVRQTRFQDNDMFGHVNNTVYYNLMDDAINVHLIERGIGMKYPRFIVENGIQFFKPISFPNDIRVGIRITKLSSKAATYDVGFYEVDSQSSFKQQQQDQEEKAGEPTTVAARGRFVHCYVSLETGRPVEIPQEARNVLETLLVQGGDEEQP